MHGGKTRRQLLQAGACTAWAAAWAPAQAQDEALTLRVGWGDSPPFQFETPQGPAGLDIELVTLWARAAGIKLQWVRATWARQLLDAQAGSLDAMMSATPTDERRVFADFTQAYRYEYQGLVALAGQGEALKDLEELEGRPVKVGVVRGVVFPPDLAAAVARPAVQRTLVPLRADDLCVAALRAGRLQYILGDVVSLRAHAERQAGPPLSVVLAFKGAPVHLLVSRHALARSPGLLNRLNEALQRVRGTPAWAQVLARYPGA